MGGGTCEDVHGHTGQTGRDVEAVQKYEDVEGGDGATGGGGNVDDGGHRRGTGALHVPPRSPLRRPVPPLLLGQRQDCAKGAEGEGLGGAPGDSG